jgi:hypothetical protein
MDAADAIWVGASRRAVQRMIPFVGSIVVVAITVALLFGTLSLRKRDAR